MKQILRGELHDYTSLAHVRHISYNLLLSERFGQRKSKASPAATVGNQKADQIQKVSSRHMKRETIFPFKALIVLDLVKTIKHFSYSSLPLKINLKCSSKA